EDQLIRAGADDLDVAIAVRSQFDAAVRFLRRRRFRPTHAARTNLWRRWHLDVAIIPHQLDVAVAARCQLDVTGAADGEVRIGIAHEAYVAVAARFLGDLRRRRRLAALLAAGFLAAG